MSLELYRPANGTEGDGFMDGHCFQCERDRAFLDGESEQGCPILTRTLMFDTDDPEYPREWCYGADGRPTCTAFVPLGTQLPTERELEEMGQASLFAA